ATPNLNRAGGPGNGNDASECALRHHLRRAQEAHPDGIEQMTFGEFRDRRRKVAKLQFDDEGAERPGVRHDFRATFAGVGSDANCGRIRSSNTISLSEMIYSIFSPMITFLGAVTCSLPRPLALVALVKNLASILGHRPVTGIARDPQPEICPRNEYPLKVA